MKLLCNTQNSLSDTALNMDEDQKKRSFSVGMAVTFGLSNAAIIVGILNFSNFQFDITDPDSASTECKGAEKIPYYLIVMGTLLIILMTLKFFFKVRITLKHHLIHNHRNDMIYWTVVCY